MTRWAIVADLNRCVGCQTCTAACKQVNATAPGVQWRKVLDFEAGEFPSVSRAFVPVGCMHCDDPPCLDVCPSTATRKRDDGIVTIDYDICIGCSYCAVACPYQARYRVDTPNEAYGTQLSMDHEVVREHWDRRSVAQKCTFCVERIDAGLAAGLTPGVDPRATPACVNACIADALHFGDADDPDSNVSRLMVENRHFRMHDQLGTGPHITYLWARANGTDAAAAEAPIMRADAIGMSGTAPQLQTSWDWRAATNFILGGAGAGLLGAAALTGDPGPGLTALALIVAGLVAVWFEIGRPWRFLNVFLHPQRSWMTREAYAASAVVGTGFLAAVSDLTWLWLLAGICAMVFLYCQARILAAAKGIPAWRQPQIVPLIASTGLAEGLGLFLVYAAIAHGHAAAPFVWAALAATLLRLVAWMSYRSALGRAGAPSAAFAGLDGMPVKLTLAHQAIPLLLLAAGLVVPDYGLLAAVGGALVLASGWLFKLTLITRAAHNQGYALTRMPARGAGRPGPGIQPGWRTA